MILQLKILPRKRLGIVIENKLDFKSNLKNVYKKANQKLKIKKP